MKKLLKFIKTTIIGGLIVIVPLAVVAFVLMQVFSVMNGITNKLAGKLPYPILEHPVVLVLLSILGVIAICFLTGLLLLTGLGDKLLNEANSALANKIPMYGMIRTLTQRLTGTEGLSFAAAEIDLYGTDVRALGFIIEALPEDRLSVFVPLAPTITVGQLYVLPSTCVTQLDKPPAEVANVITQWGIGSCELYTDNPAPAVDESD